MRLPLSWLQEYLGLDITAEMIETACTDIGIEVDSIEELYPLFKGVIAGKIVEKKAHPKAAAKLFLVDLIVGKEKTIQLVTSDIHCYPGMIVPVAIVGASINGTAIQRADFIGISSDGMLLSEQELSLGDQADRVLELPSNYTPGMDLSFLGRETLFHLSLTPNLGHCFSVYGVAREIAAKLAISLQKKWDSMPANRKEYLKRYAASHSLKKSWDIILSDTNASPSYSLLELENIRVGPSPYSWRRRLFLCGMRSINVVVDALNLIMLEIGQPMHAFDIQAFAGERKVEVALLQNSSKELVLLNGQEKSIPQKSMVIANHTGQPIAVAGVIGMKEGSIELEKEKPAQSIVIESAFFNPSFVRRSSKNIDITTESSKRFERGVDPEGAIRAQGLVIELLSQVAPSLTIRSFDIVTEKNELPQEKKIALRVSRASKLLGLVIDESTINDLCNRLSYKKEWINNDLAEIVIPAYRHDIQGEVDLIEEIAKLKGFSAFNREEIPLSRIGVQPTSPLYQQEKRVRNALVHLGLQECITSSLIGPSSLHPILDHPIPKNSIVTVQNPMSQDQSILRPTLLPGLIDVLKRNLAFRQKSLALFEIGTIFMRSKGAICEKKVLSVLLFGTQEPSHPLLEERSTDFYDLKGVWENFVQLLHIDGIEIGPSKEDLYHPGRQAALMMEGARRRVGLLGEIHPKMAAEFDIPKRVYFMEVDFQDIFTESSPSLVQMAPLHIYPSVERDWTITLPKEILYQELCSIIDAQAAPLLESYELVSLFENEKVQEKNKLWNITIRMVFRDLHSTLEQHQVDSAFQSIVQNVLDQLSPLIKVSQQNI